MESVVTVLNFILQLGTSFFSFLMSSWVTALFVIGSILVLIVDLVVTSSSGGGDKQ